MKFYKLKSPGKINVRLDVLNKRKDGYHDLRMINTLITLYDDIEFCFTEKGLVVECENDATVPDGEDNIVYKAAKEIMAYSNKHMGLHIKIKKTIPSCAGMGGGSSNAASVLIALNDILKLNLSKEKLMKIGAKFGADVPFFIAQSPAIAQGIGEKITRIKKMPKLPLLVITPNIKVPTKWVFENFKSEKKSKNSISSPQIPLNFSTKKSLIKYLNNDLECVTIQKYPVINDIKAILLKMGALAAQMTGSGPTVFGIFADKESAEKACNKLKPKLRDFSVHSVENII